MSATLTVSVLLALSTSAVLAGFLTYLSMRLTLLDIPNERSSHSAPTPRGGGLAIVATSSIGFAVAALLGILDTGLALALLVGGLAVAIVGFLDDRRGLPASVRLAVHAGAAVLALHLLGGTPLLQVGSNVVELDGVWYPVSVLGVLWTLNLFNFMDGIDGIAASEAVFVSLAGGVLGLFIGISSGIAVAASVLAGCCIGFLMWNWPPARIFMGDVGSGYLGFVIAVLAIASAVEHPVMVPVWLVLGALFFVDATVTLMRRLARGERVYEAHRLHAYQWLARRWGSHARVTMCFVFANLIIILPLATWCALQPKRAIFIVIGAVVLFGVAALCAGSGKAEQSGSRG